jgi:hypothetical protein
MNLSSAAILGVLISLAIVTSADAKRRPTIDTVYKCMHGAGDKECDGTLCTCCYDEGSDAGCWICDDGPLADNCVFDPKYSNMKGDAGATVPETLTISPDTGSSVPFKRPEKGKETKPR